MDLSGNNLNSLPFSLSKLLSLIELNVQGNTVAESLTLSGANLSEVPLFVNLITSLSVLNLSSNKLSTLVSKVNWETFEASDISFELQPVFKITPPSDLNQNRNLASINIIGNFEKLKYISARNCNFSSIPIQWAIWSSSTLRTYENTLDISENPIYSLDWSLSYTGKTINSVPKDFYLSKNLG